MLPYFCLNHKGLARDFLISFFSNRGMSVSLPAMRTHLLLLTILAWSSVACTRKMIQVPVNRPVQTAKKPGSESSNTSTVTDDSLDLAQQLRDPDLLNRIDDPAQNANDKQPMRTPGSKPVVIRGSDVPPEPLQGNRQTPAPPIGKPDLPNTNE